MALAIAGLWMVAPDRSAMVRTTQRYLADATAVLRVAAGLERPDRALAGAAHAPAAAA